MRRAPEKASSKPVISILSAFTFPQALLVMGVLLILASFLPLGDWAAKSQWTPADSATYDQISKELKRTTYEPPARAGLTAAEQEAQREKMLERLRAFQAKLDRAKSQPKRWSRYLLWVGSLLAATGFFAQSARDS